MTTKYNPARTWTAENSVGIGGAYLCVYGMEGPGGYQFVGRTLQMWNRYHAVEDFGGKPWLLRFFDQIRFYPVSAEELLTIRRDFPLGRYPLRIEHTTLKLAEYQQFLAANGQAHFDSSEVLVTDAEDAPLAPGQAGIDSPVSGNLWQVNVEVGNTVREGDVLVVLESMKMEIPLVATQDGVVSQVRVQPGSSVRAGQCVVVLEKTA